MTDEWFEERARKLGEMSALGLPLLPNRFGPTHSSTEIIEECSRLEGERVRVAGRLMRVRLMGKAAFAHIQDSNGQLQLYFKKDLLGDSAYEYFKLLDNGDLIGAEGTVFITRTGETSVQVESLVLLAKSYRPLPDKYHGLNDVEMRYRRRYIDLIANEESRAVFRVRSSVVRSLRRFLDERGFMEVETPILQPIYGGAAAGPFTTRYNALDMTAYLRVATELYLKRLVVGGFDRVYEIGKDFRNEGFSRKNSPEFTMLELYQAYADYQDIMSLNEEMFAAVCVGVVGSLVVKHDNVTLDFSPPWRRLSVAEAIREYVGLELSAETGPSELLRAARDREIAVDAGATRGKLVEELVSSLVEPQLIQPTFLYDFPVDFPGSLLAKRKAGQPDTAERFELYIGGMEIANAFTELNDPFDQRQRMEEAAQLSGEEHQEIDEDFLLALEHGMPPTGGLGFGIDRLVMLLTGVHHIRETILFPLLRPRENVHVEP